MEHLDEGTIHTWLDGELSEPDAAALEAHARTCESCSSLISEARGLTAASSRILRSLDEVPANVVPLGVESLRTRSAEVGAEQSTLVTGARHREGARRTWFRRPQFAAAAALLIVAAGTWRVTRDQSNATIADFAAPVVPSEAPATSILDSAALSTATATADQIAERAPSPVGNMTGAAKKAAPVSPSASPAQEFAGARAGRAAAEREAVSPKAESSAPGRIAPVPPAADAAAERKASGDSIGGRAASAGSGSSTEAARRALADSIARKIALEQGVVTGMSDSRPRVSAALADSATRSEERRARGETAAALGAARGDSLTRQQNQAVARAAVSLRDAAPVDAAVAQAAGCYDLAGVRSAEASLPARMRLNTAITRREPLIWYEALGYPASAVPSQWVWRIVSESGIQLARVEGDRRVLTVMISGPAAITADRVVCP